MFSVFTQKKSKSKDRGRLTEQCDKELNDAIGTLISLGVSQQEVLDTIHDLDCMNRDRDDSCAAAAAAPATFAAAAAPDIFDDDDI